MMRRIVLLTLAVALFLAWLLMLRPVFLGGPASYVMVSGTSMQPTLHEGDLAVLRQQGEYGRGDLVAFRVDGGIVIHRIVGGNAEEGFITQGDNKKDPDPWKPKPQDILGKAWFHVPGGGPCLLFLREPLILGSVAGGLGMLTVLSGGSGKPPRPRGTSRSRPRAASLGGPPGTRLILGLVMAAALTRAIGLPQKRGRGAPG